MWNLSLLVYNTPEQWLQWLLLLDSLGFEPKVSVLCFDTGSTIFTVYQGEKKHILSYDLYRKQRDFTYICISKKKKTTDRKSARECPGVLWWLTFLRIIHSYNLNDPEGLFPSCSCVQNTAMADFPQCSVTSSKWKMTSSFFTSTLYTSFDSCIYIGLDQCTLTQVLHHRRFSRQLLKRQVLQAAIVAGSKVKCHKIMVPSLFFSCYTQFSL